MNTEHRRLQLSELQMLKDVKRVCEENGIQYFLDGGTLLGAVRHKGFIPWDDDIDITMPYEDYIKFLSIAPTALGDKYFVQNARSEKGFYGAFTKIRNNNTTFMPIHHCKYHINQGIWIDIFPLARIAGDREVKFKKKIIQVSNYLLMKEYIAANYESFRKHIGERRLAILKVLYHVPYRLRLFMHEFLVRYVISSKKGNNLTCVWTGITDVFPQEVYFGKKVELLFEDEMFNVPCDYKQYLTIQYGDYMTLPPIEERRGHGSMILDFNQSCDLYLR